MKTQALASVALAVSALMLSFAASAASPLKFAVFNAAKTSPWPVSSVLLEGQKDAVLVDAQFTRTDAQKLVDKIKESGKTLISIYVSQGDPDFYFGLAVVKAAYPDVPVYATAATVARIKATQESKQRYWGPILKSEAPKEIIIPQVLKGTSMTLEGQQILVKSTGSKTPERTYLWVPSLQAVAGGTLVFGNLHVFLADAQSDVAKRGWLRALAQMNALKPATVVPGHFKEGESMSAASVAFTTDYIQAYMAEAPKAANSAALIKAMKDKYPDAGFDQALEISAKVSKGEMKW